MTFAATVPVGPPALQRLVRRLPLRELRDAGGLHWRYRDTQADGPVLVLLPGAAGGGDVAFKLVDAMGEQVRMISVTYPGGASAQQLADGLAELLDHLVVGKVAVWGSSYGAWWAQAFATRHAGRTAALWLGNTFVDRADVAHLPLFDSGWLSRSAPGDVQRRWLDVVAASPPSELRDLQLYFIGQTLSAEALRARLLDVATSTELAPATGIERMVVSDCDDDPVIGAATRDSVAARHPGCRRVRLPTGGHYPHLTNSETLVIELRRWLGL